MSYKVIVKLTGSNITEKVFNKEDAKHIACRNIFQNYKANSWIKSYTSSIVDSSTKEETFIMDSAGRWDSYVSEMDLASGNESISVFNSTIISKTEV